MKRNLLFILAALLPLVASASLTANGQETYKPMLKDGRVWNCIEIHYKAGKLDTLTHEYRIEGTIEKDGHVCYNLYRGSNQIGLYYEEGAKVFRYTASGWELLFDFSLSPGEVASEYNTVGEVKTIVMKGVPRRCLFFPWVSCWWIEGIGSSFSGPNYFNFDIPVIGSFVCMKLMSVYDGDVCIFEADDLYSEEYREPLPFLEGNPIWEYKYEHISMPRDPNLKCWIDTGERVYTYFFLGGKKEIEGRSYTMMGEVRCDRDGKITLSRWLPVREENGIVYAITDSLPGVVETEDNYDARYNDDYPMPYLRQGNECVLYNFSTDIGETLYPQNEGSTVKSIDTYQLLDGTECRVLKTQWAFYDLYEKLGLLNADPDFGIMDPFIGWPVSLNGHIYLNILNAYYQDNIMLYKAPDARDGLCVNDTCWTRDDAEAYARSYKADPYQEKVFSFIRQLQMATKVTFTKDQMATIILPTAPDAGKGKYYRLDKCEDGKIIFEQEKQPQARTPYIIVPNEDFSIDPSTLDLAGLSPDTVSIAGISFIGTYTSKVLPSLGGDGGGSYYDIIDTTPDCQAEEGKAYTIGALHAYLTVNWDDPINHSGSKGPDDKMGIVLKDYGTSISLTPTLSKGEGVIYDLQGRRLSGKPERGIYIEDGKKKVK